MKHLVPCAGCARHVRASEARCPFCAAPIEAAARPADPPARLSRAALFAFGTAATALTACNGSLTPPPPPPPTTMVAQPTPTPVPPPPPSAAPSEAPSGMMMARYGAPPPADFV